MMQAQTACAWTMRTRHGQHPEVWCSWPEERGAPTWVWPPVAGSKLSLSVLKRSMGWLMGVSTSLSWKLGEVGAGGAAWDTKAGWGWWEPAEEGWDPDSYFFMRALTCRSDSGLGSTLSAVARAAKGDPLAGRTGSGSACTAGGTGPAASGRLEFWGLVAHGGGCCCWLAASGPCLSASRSRVTEAGPSAPSQLVAAGCSATGSLGSA